MANLYELSNQFAMIQQIIEDGAEGFEQALADIQGEISEKLDGYAMVIKNLESDNAGIKAEENRLTARRKHNENAIARMKERMAETLEMVEPDDKGVKRVKTEKFTFSFRKSTSVKVEDESVIPPQFIKVEKTISRAELAKALKNGEHIEGAALIENQSLSIR